MITSPTPTPTPTELAVASAQKKLTSPSAAACEFVLANSSRYFTEHGNQVIIGGAQCDRKDVLIAWIWGRFFRGQPVQVATSLANQLLSDPATARTGRGITFTLDILDRLRSVS